MRGKNESGETPALEQKDDGSVVTEERVFVPAYEKAVAKGLNVIVWVSIVSIIAMLVITVVDVAARATLSWSLPGAYEYSKYLMVLVAAVALPYTALNDGHVEVDMLTRRMPPAVRKVLGVANFLIVLFYAAILTVQNWNQAAMTKLLNLKPVDVPFPQYPFYYIIAIGVALLLVVVLVKCVNYLRGVK
jgi:TRAP-type C4-dicarboxylate transport system permease small subunit